MTVPTRDREFDLVLFGATGFTGGLTAEYLAGRGDPDLRWAIAGRSYDRLAAVQQRLAGTAPGQEPQIVVADSTDPVSLRALADRTRVVISTVGPYLEYGAPLVAACAAAGTDYVDLTGEPEFVDRMWLENHDTAVATGARLVHACGFDSIPHDLGALFTVQQFDGDEPIDLRGVVRAKAGMSGGTFGSALNAFGRMSQARDAARRRRARETRPDARSAKAVAAKPRRDSVLDYWLVPLPTIDPLIVARSAAALPEYGPRFRYSHFVGCRILPTAVGGSAAVGGLMLAARFAPIRKQLERRLPAGEGPSAERREHSWFTVDFVGESGDRTVHTRVSGGDPGYGETSKMLAESALSLAFDDNPEVAGQLTTAQAMGESLTRRLIEQGIRFEVVEDRVADRD